MCAVSSKELPNNQNCCHFLNSQLFLLLNKLYTFSIHRQDDPKYSLSSLFTPLWVTSLCSDVILKIEIIQIDQLEDVQRLISFTISSFSYLPSLNTYTLSLLLDILLPSYQIRASLFLAASEYLVSYFVAFLHFWTEKTPPASFPTHSKHLLYTVSTVFSILYWITKLSGKPYLPS